MSLSLSVSLCMSLSLSLFLSSLANLPIFDQPLTYATFRGHPFMTYTKNQVFDPCPHGPDIPPLLWTSICSQHEIHIAVLKWLVQWPSGPIDEIRLYDCNLF